MPLNSRVGLLVPPRPAWTRHDGDGRLRHKFFCGSATKEQEGGLEIEEKQIFRSSLSFLDSNFEFFFTQMLLSDYQF